MKKTSAICAVIFIVFAVFVHFPFIAKAAARAETKPAVKATVAIPPAPAEKPKIKTRDQERLIAIVTERANILKSRWTALSDRLDRLSGRTSSLLAKLDKAGFDTTTAETLLQTADFKIAAARELADETSAVIVARAGNSDGTARDLRKIETTVINPGKESVGKAFQEAKNALNDCLAALPQ